MTAFDETLLDEPAQLARRDEGRLLWSLATAGAQVRRAIETANDWNLEGLRDTQAPRSLLVAVDGALGGSRLLTRLSCDRAPSLAWHGVELPRWAGPADTLLVGSLDGRHPRLAGLVDQAQQRGVALAVVAPAGSPVAVAAGRAPLHELPTNLHPRASRWSVLAPLLQVLDVLQVTSVPRATLVELADALDLQAEACRPDSDAFTNPAKALAVAFAETLPVVAGAGALAGVAARTISDTLQLFAGSPATSVSLPDAVGRAGSLLRGNGGAHDDDDIFRDRVDDPEPDLRPRLLVLGDDGDPDDPLLGERSDAQIQLDEVAARRAARALRDLADALGVATSGVDVPAGDKLARFASAVAFGDFTAAYLAFGRNLDPGAPGPAERDH